MVDSLKGITIGELDLGSADGAREAKNEKFSKLFYEKQSDYKLIRHNPDKFLITGKKGSGKTYLAKYLQYKVQKEGALSHTITWDDINLNRLIEFEESNNEDDNELFYKYVIYIEIAKAVISCPTYKLAKPFFHPIKYLKALYYKDKIKRFYNERYPSGNYSIEHIKHNTESSSKVDLDTVIKGLGVSNELLVSDEYTIKKNQIFCVLNRLENLINDYMRVIPVILVSDDLDEQEMSLLSDQGFKEFLIRYLNVTNIINQNIQNYNSKCIVVIRDDLLDTVQSKSSNINKLITDATVLINWCEKADKKPWE